MHIKYILQPHSETQIQGYCNNMFKEYITFLCFIKLSIVMFPQFLFPSLNMIIVTHLKPPMSRNCIVHMHT